MGKWSIMIEYELEADSEDDAWAKYYGGEWVFSDWELIGAHLVEVED